MLLASSFDDDRLTDVVLAVRRDETAHECEQIVLEQGIEDAIVDPPGPPLDHFHVFEPNLLQFLDEVTLRQGPGHSAGPRRGMRQHFGRQGVLLDG